MDTAGEAQSEKGPALVRVLVHGAARIQAEPILERGNEGVRPQKINHLCPSFAESELLPRQQHDNSVDYPHLQKGRDENSYAVATAPGVGASGQREAIPRCVDNQNHSFHTLDQDLREGKVYNAHDAIDHMQKMDHILLPSDVQQTYSSEQQPGKVQLRRYPSKGKELLSGALAPEGPGGNGSLSEKDSGGLVRYQNRSGDVILDPDVGNGKLYDGHDAVAGRDAESGDLYPRRPDNDDDSVCRICHMNSAAAEIVNLGCACKLDLSQAHRRCADTWFAFRGNRECEICGEIAQNVNPPESPMGGRLEQDQSGETLFILNIQWRALARCVCLRSLVICVMWLIVVFVLYRILIPNFRKAADEGGT